MEKALRVLLVGKAEHRPIGTLTGKRTIAPLTVGTAAEIGDPGKLLEPSTQL